MNELNLNEIRMLDNDKKKEYRTKTSVYSRIVGYVRRIDAWNPGKKAEFHDRKLFSTDSKDEITAQNIT